MIELVNVSRIYRRGADEVHALERVTLRVERGRFAALMGPSGSGKSTLLHLIAGLDQPTGGTVSVAGHRLAGGESLVVGNVGELREGDAVEPVEAP